MNEFTSLLPSWQVALEALRGELRGKHSIRINDQWRVVFRWEKGDAHEVEIVDYH